MIERDLLRQLGWSDELIDEVTREATPMRSMGVQIVDPTQLTSEIQSSASTSIYYGGMEENSSRQLVLRERD